MTSAANSFGRQSERGTIETVDPQQHTLTVRDGHNGSIHTYAWNTSTAFLQHTRPLSRSRSIGVAEVKPGEQVNVYYKHEGDSWLARKVVVTGNSQASLPRKGGVETQS